MNSTQANRDLIRSFNGYHVGTLSDEEIESFNRFILDGFAKRVYEGTGGFMGLAKVRVVE